MLRKVIHRWERKLSQRDVNRMSIPFEWGLDYLNDHLDRYPQRRTDSHGRAARDLLFAVNERAISESDQFFSAPAVTDFAFDGEWLPARVHHDGPSILGACTHDEPDILLAMYRTYLDRALTMNRTYHYR